MFWTREDKVTPLQIEKEEKRKELEDNIKEDNTLLTKLSKDKDPKED